MVNTIVGLAIYAAMAFVLYTAGIRYNDWQFWAVLVLMVIDKANLRDYFTGSAFPPY